MNPHLQGDTGSVFATDTRRHQQLSRLFHFDGRFSSPAVQEITSAAAQTLRSEPRGRTNPNSSPAAFVIGALVVSSPLREPPSERPPAESAPLISHRPFIVSACKQASALIRVGNPKHGRQQLVCRQNAKLITGRSPKAETELGAAAAAAAAGWKTPRVALRVGPNGPEEQCTPSVHVVAQYMANQGDARSLREHVFLSGFNLYPR